MPSLHASLPAPRKIRNRGAKPLARRWGWTNERFFTDNLAKLPEGTHLEVETGRLYRYVDGHGLVSVNSNNQIEMMKLSDDPYMPVSSARLIASENDIHPDF